MNGNNKRRRCLLLGLSLALILLLFPIATPVMANPGVTVSIFPILNSRFTGGDFWVYVNVTQVTDLDTYLFDVTYDPAIIQVVGIEGGAGVTGGQIVDTIPNPDITKNIPITWGFPGGVQGKIRVAGDLNAPDLQGANGTGYLCKIHFLVVGSAGQTGDITPAITEPPLGMWQTRGGPLEVSQAVTGKVSVLYPPVSVSVSAPANVPAGGDFVARITTSLVANLSSYQFDISYNASKIQVIGAEFGSGVTSGLVGTTVIPVDTWSFQPPLTPSGRIRVLSHIPSNGAVTGAGYIAEIHFHVLASSGSDSINFVTGFNWLFNNLGLTITPVGWSGATVNIVIPISITTSSLPDASAGVFYSSNLTAINGATPYAWSATGLPAGLSVSPGGVISGTPTVSGDFSIDVTVNDASSPVLTGSKTLALHVNPPLEITTSSLPQATMGKVYPSTNVLAAGGTTPYTWSATGLPAGMSISPGGVISGTPTASGDFSVNVTVNDTSSPVKTANKTLALHVNPPLLINTSSLPDAMLARVYSASVTASGGNGVYTWSATGLPGGLLISTAGVITGTPTVSGDFNVNVTVTDSFVPANTDSKILVLRVYNGLQITTSALAEGAAGSAYSYNLAASGGKTQYSWGATGLPAGLFIATSGNIAGTPSVFGDFSVNITVTDSFIPPNTMNAALNLHVYSPLQIMTLSLSDGVVGKPYSASIEASGGKPGYSWSAIGMPAGLSISTSGVITGTPAVSGDFSVTVTVTDALTPASSKSASMNLHIYGALQISTASLAEGLKGSAYSANAAASGGKSGYFWSATGLAAGLSMSTAGAITGTATESGDFSVNITVTDSFSPANSVSKTLILKVYLPRDANGDGVINMADVIKIERIILGRDVTTVAADANGDGTVNMGDVTKIERVILEIDP